MPEPVAYLLREQRPGWNGPGKSAIICGKMFMNLETATAAAERMTNHWRRVTVVPVQEVK